LDSNLTAVSLFAGIGGFDLALSNAGVKVCASVEIDKKCRDVLAKHFPETQLFSDIKDVTGEQLRAAGFIPERGIITAGFPCQDLSVAGLRKGLAGSRSGLFWEIIRLVDETQPRYLIIENVAGLLSSQSGRDLGIVIEALVERRYGIAWRVLDSQHFGVPQRRRRVFIVASLGEHRSPVEVLFEPESRTGHLEASTKKKQNSARLSTPGTDVHTFTKSRRASSDTDYETWVESDITPTLNQFDIADTRTTTIITEPQLFDATRNADVRFYDQSPTMKARWGTGGNNVPMLALPIQDGRDIEKKQNGLGVGVTDAPSYTLDATGAQAVAYVPRVATMQGIGDYADTGVASTMKQRDYKDATDLVVMQPDVLMRNREGKPGGGKGPLMSEDISLTIATSNDQTLFTKGTVRRLTPTECERLQSFPDGWTAGQSDSARYKQLGNAVTVSVVAWIVNRMVSVDEANTK
jgi:DNA (cytosine-5)-methyltransferase 1